MRRKIFIIVNFLLDGGIEHFLLNYLQNYPFQAEFDISIIYSTAQSQSVLAAFEKLGVNLIQTKRSPLKHRLRYALELYRLFKKERPLVVHAHLLQNGFLALAPAKHARIQKRIAHAHSNMSNDFRLSTIRRFIRKFKLRLTDNYSTTRLASSKIAGDTSFKNAYDILPNAINLYDFQPKPTTRAKVRKQLQLSKNTKLYVFIGRLHPDKNPEFAIQTFIKIHQQQPNSKLLIVGSGHLKKHLTKYLRNPYIIHLEHVSNINDYYQAADLVLVPSVREGLSLVAIEAQFCSTPVLASNALPKETKVSNYIHYQNLDSSDAWAKHAIKLTTSTKSRIAYNRHADSFDIALAAPKLFSYYSNQAKNITHFTPQLSSAVSIIVPIYNVEKYLAQCLESLIAQTHHNLKIYAVNDGSTDDSFKIAQQFAKKDHRIICINKSNGGYGSVLESTIKQIDTQYFMICDPDDWLTKQTVEILYTEAIKNDLDFITADRYDIHEDGTIKYGTADVSPHAKLYRTTLAKNIRFPKHTSFTDFLLYLGVVLKANRTQHLAIPLAYYRIDRPSNTNTDRTIKAIQDHITGLNSILQQFKQLWPHRPDLQYFLFKKFKVILKLSYNIPKLPRSTFRQIKALRHQLRPYRQNILAAHHFSRKKHLDACILLYTPLPLKLYLFVQRTRKRGHHA